MITRRQKWKLMIFLLGAAVLAAALLLLFTRERFLHSSKSYYVHVPDSVNGLEQGASVTVRGVPVGNVSAIELSHSGPEGVRVTLEIDREVAIANDSHATLSLKGVTGLKYVSISGGHRESGSRPPRSYIPYEASTLQQVADEASTLVAQAGRVLGSTHELVAQLTALSQALDPSRIERIAQSTARAAEHFEQVGAQLSDVIQQTRLPLQRSLRSADEALSRAAQVGVDASGVLGNVNAVTLELRDVIRQNEGQLRASAQNLREATQTFKYLGRELRQKPSRLLLGGALPERSLP